MAMDTDIHKQTASWLERVEDIVHVIKDSSIGEIELTEGETEIIIKRQPQMVLTALPTSGVVITNGATPSSNGHAARIDQSIPIVAPLTGVYYSSPSPTTPPFVSVGDVIHVGQVVALVEAMKVFNEITADVSGRVVTLPVTNGAVVQKGEALIKVEPLG